MRQSWGCQMDLAVQSSPLRWWETRSVAGWLPCKEIQGPPMRVMSRVKLHPCFPQLKAWGSIGPNRREGVVWGAVREGSGGFQGIPTTGAFLFFGSRGVER